MRLRDARIGWRLLLKEPGYSLAVVLGLAVGFAVGFLLLGLVRYSTTYNEAIADSAHIFVVKERRNMLPRPDWRATAPAPLRDVATRSGPRVSATSARSFDLAARIGNRVVPLILQVADASFLEFFGIRSVEGDAQAALGRPDALVLSQSQARKLFGAVHAIGKRLSIDGTPFEVKAIIADLPANTSVRYDVLLGAGLHSWDPLPTRAGAEWFRAGAAAALGFASPPAALGQMFNDSLRIVGVAPDLRYQMLRQAAGPMVYRIDAAQGVLTARVEGGAIATVRPQVEALLARHSPNDVPDIESAGAVFAHNYSDDLRLAQILTAASVVATALASFGIYVLSAYSVRRRSREIVLRKLYGAGGFDVGRLIAREFAGLTGIGALIGLPAAWFATERYLSGFVERAPLGWWPPLLALGCVGLVALAATGRHTLAAVRMSPALALRD